MPLVRRPPADQTPVQQDGLAAISARLKSASGDTRWEAARQLAAWPEAVRTLAARLPGEPDPRVREAILTSLARINTVESFEIVLEQLRVDEASMRTASLDVLKLMPEMVGLRLDALLQDRDPDIRILACDLARAAPPLAAEKSLAAILATEAEINVCAAAIDLLAEIGTVESLPQLQTCAARFSAPFLDFSVKMATAQIGARSVRPGE